MPGKSITKPCHNCRRRRLRCDRSWPSCHKCASSGQECLGYGKVFVWTQAIDSDGNPRPPPVTGRKWSEQRQHPPRVLEYRVPHEVGEAQEAGNLFVARGQEAFYRSSQDRVATHQSILQAFPQNCAEETCQGEPDDFQSRFAFQDAIFMDEFASSQKNAFTDKDGNKCSVYNQHAEPNQRLDRLKLSTCGSLTDPVFQDLDQRSRYYLAHFADSVCKDLVARDTPSSNPFRELIPLTNNHPLLLQILIATSAIHCSNMFRPVSALPIDLSDPGGYLVRLRSQDLTARQALIDALTAKQKALGHLRHVLDSLDTAGSEVSLAAMHFFVNFDLIDLDRNNKKSWQVHIEGTSSILALLAPDPARHVSSRLLLDCVIADCFIYHILGSTLATSSIACRVAQFTFELVPVMKRVEANSYLSCPPEILQIILLASQLSHETSCNDWTSSAADQALHLIDEALSFDIAAWADGLRTLPNVSDMESRIHIASAHRSAVCLYILQALPLIRAARPVDTMFLVGDILGHLGQIDERDPYFKATSWPMFIAGAETRDAGQRAWAMTRMLSIWEICPWGYIFTAMDMLKATWQMQDSGAGSGLNWLRDLKDMGFDCLIV
ncbi:hypothetical protein E4U42_004379 [Claviceps africana]|uniref:Zn(2)-C6 fungal-type domain-containing protein n=1 Tax=Claviceps africana TaxID=83212 RepID=A0A8K0J5I6_9HYPO|nr:hypothetical protein E4U42_004379 [Claviceps africana]